MGFYIINGSPRKKCNTSQLLHKVGDGIKDNSPNDVEINHINLYDLDYKGCKSCFHCKKINGKYYGQCPIKDDLRELLPKLWNADGIILGSPVYFGDVTGETRSFLERLLFPKFVYGGETLLKNNISIGLVYTMNLNEENGSLYNDTLFNPLENLFKYHTNNILTLKSYDTYQFKDYNKYENYLFSEELKAKRRKEHFPKDLKDAYILGKNISK